MNKLLVLLGVVLADSGCATNYWQLQAFKLPTQSTTQSTTVQSTTQQSTTQQSATQQSTTQQSTGNTSGQVGSNGCFSDSKCPPGNWAIAFDDEFNGNSLDKNKWKVKPAGEVIANQGCSGGSAGISVGGGFLTLSPVEPSTVNCSGYTPQGACGKPCGGEEIVTPTGYGPGYFEARLQGAGTYNVFYMPNYSPNNCVTNEISDTSPMESWGANGFQQEIAVQGYGACQIFITHPGNDCSTGTCIADKFHLLGLLYGTDGTLTYYYDGQVMWTYGPVATNGRLAPDFTVFGEAGQGGNQPMTVDWVRYYAPQ